MFEGFSPEAIDFLWGLRLNNNREWFEAHKQTYQQMLYRPMLALAAEVGAAFSDLPDLRCKTSRIYRDARLHPPVPYKETLWFCLRPDARTWSEEPSLFFEIGPEHYSYGFLYWHPTADAKERLRRTLTDNPKALAHVVKAVEKETGLTLTGEVYHRKRPAANEVASQYCNLKNFWAYADLPVGGTLFTAELADEVIRTWRALRPLQQYFLQLA